MFPPLSFGPHLLLSKCILEVGHYPRHVEALAKLPDLALSATNPSPDNVIHGLLTGNDSRTWIILLGLLSLAIVYPYGNLKAVDAYFFGASSSTESGLNTSVFGLVEPECAR